MSQLLRNLVQRTAGLGLVALAALGLGLLQEILLARRFGTGPEADAFAAALLLPTVLMTVLGNAASGAYLAHHSGSSGGGAFVRSVLLVGLALAALLAGLAPQIVALVYGGFPPATARLCAALLRPLALVAAAGSLFALLKARYNARGIFVRPSAAGLLVPAACSGALLFGAGIEPVARTAALAWLLQLVLLGRAGSWWRDSGPARREWSVALPLALVAALGFAYQPIGRALAARLIDGGVAALRYSDNILQLPVALIYIPLATVVLPALAAHALGSRIEAYRELFGAALRWVLRAGLCIAALIWTLRAPLVAAIYRGGAFDADSAALVTKLIGAGALFTLPLALSSLSTPALIALRRIRTLAALGALFCGANLLLLVLLVPAFGLVGVVLATALAACVSEGCALALLRRSGHARLDAGLLRSAGRALLGALAAAAAAVAARSALAGVGWPILTVAIAGAAGLLVFVPVALTSEERRATLRALVSRISSPHT
ncbi:MAG TPA: lipid II flippase MurJ [Acidobacteriota bacterium]